MGCCGIQAIHLRKAGREVTTARSIFHSLTENIPQLNTYGLDQNSMLTLKAQIDTYETSLKTKESGSNQSKIARREMKNTFRTIDLILHEKLDKMIELVKKDNPDFYNRYFAARDIKDLGYRWKPRQAKQEKQDNGNRMPGL